MRVRRLGSPWLTHLPMPRASESPRHRDARVTQAFPVALPIDLQVPAGDADEARRILAELSTPESQP